MPTALDGAAEQQGELELTSGDIEEGEPMPDWVGYANENENPGLEINGVPDDAETLVLIMDDPDAEPVVGHVYDHWLVWDIPADTTEIPRNWEPSEDEATVGFNDYAEAAWGGPAPPQGSHTYHFKLYALDGELGAAPETRKARLGSTIAFGAEVLASTELTATYDAEQGTIF